MIPDENKPDSILDNVIDGIRGEQIDAATADRAAARVFARLSAHSPLRNCADFQALIPAYRSGALPDARALLVRDHLHECVACRKAASGRADVVARPAPRAWVFPVWRWAMAAALAAAVGLGAWGVWNRSGAPRGRITVLAADAGLYRVTTASLERLMPGSELPGGAEIRTAGGAAVLRLADGSLIEMNDRSGLAVTGTRSDTNVRLTRGSVIVQAAKRRTGHLYVDTRDCKVAVTGTVFSVNSGVKGSRVSVIEGEVKVSQQGRVAVLRPGDQYTSSESLSPVPVEDEIAWSRDREKHMALLREFAVLRNKLQDVHMPGVRYSSRLMRLLPADTAVYAAIPNLGQALTEAQQIFEQRVRESAVLREWWEQKTDGGKREAELEEAINKIRAVSEYLGDEIVIAATVDATGKLQDPMILAEVTRTGLREFLEKEAPGLEASGHLVLRPNLLAISPSMTALGAVSASAEATQTGAFASTPFGSRVAAAYRDGAGLLFSVDLERIMPQREKTPAGFNEMKYLVVEQREVAGKTGTQAELGFTGQRHGIASWIATPGPIGALDFISPDASFATAFLTKDPSAVLADVIALNPNAGKEMAEAEAKLGLNLQQDLAGPIGAEFAFALDGPALPTPAWKLVVEVSDLARLQAAFEKLIEVVNRETAQAGQPKAQIGREVAGERTWYSVVVPGGKRLPEIHYTFVDGYLLAGASRALLERAIQNRAVGYTLARSSGFAALMPRDGHTNFSGLLYHNLGPAIQPLVSGLGVTGALSSERQKSAEALSAEMKPVLIVFYGEEDRITLASRGSLVGLGLSNLVGIPGPLNQPGRSPRKLR